MIGTKVKVKSIEEQGNGEYILTLDPGIFGGVSRQTISKEIAAKFKVGEEYYAEIALATSPDPSSIHQG